MCDKDSEGSGELRLETSLSVGEEEVEVEAAGCRSVVVLISGCGCGGAGAAAGAGISAFLAMGQVKLTRASEIEAGLNANLEAEEQSHSGAYTHSTPTTVEDGVDEAHRQRKQALPLHAVSPTAGCSCQHRPETGYCCCCPTDFARGRLRTVEP